MDYPRFCPLRYSLDKDFATFTAQDLSPFYTCRNYYRPLCNQSLPENFGSTIENGKDKYKLNLDVQHFQPEEVSVKVTDKEIIIEGNHEERQDDHSFVSRQFKRRYALPSNCPPENVVSTLSSDGVLTVIAEKISNEKVVPIKICGSCPTQVECRATGITQKDIDDAIREANELISKDKAKVLKEDHSRLLKPELMGEAISENNKMFNLFDASSDQFNLVAGASSKLQETVGKISEEMSESAQQYAKSSKTATSKRSALKAVSESVSQEMSSYKSTVTSSGSERVTAKLRETADKM